METRFIQIAHGIYEVIGADGQYANYMVFRSGNEFRVTMGAGLKRWTFQTRADAFDFVRARIAHPTHARV